MSTDRRGETVPLERQASGSSLPKTGGTPDSLPPGFTERRNSSSTRTSSIVDSPTKDAVSSDTGKSSKLVPSTRVRRSSVLGRTSSNLQLNMTSDSSVNVGDPDTVSGEHQNQH